ncbi:LOW QUALITY PROTEIN: hypothetical protein ACHAWU_008685 [Discostella pseudostelligera]|uniref:UvrD-like helicase ATP-binding domain-containing protein n=1 Tax=Discostella pseudostelligera TaxID=259834 RepID=A0ABD3M4Y9_9STRA
MRTEGAFTIIIGYNQPTTIKHFFQMKFIQLEKWEKSDMFNDKDGDDIDDLSTTNNDARERQNRRLQSLIHFNQATAQQNKLSSSSSSSNLNGAERRSTSHEDGGKLGTENDLLNLPHIDLSQLQAIRSNAPAILLPSGPGTGKTHVLSLRIAYLLRKNIIMKRRNLFRDSEFGGKEFHLDSGEEDCATPDSIVILSFTNRDAERLKERALDCLFPSHSSDSHQMGRNETSRQLWAGTMHAFSLAILNKYGPSSSPLRVLPAREMRNRVSASLRSLMFAHEGGQITPMNSEIRALQARHLQARRCWAFTLHSLSEHQAGIPLTSPEPLSVAAVHEAGNSVDEDMDDHGYQQRELYVTKACMELAMRLGIPKSSAMLALDVFPAFQARHAEAGTADPSDLAGMAYRLLIAQPESLRLLRSKLKHVIVDEYQDMSVSQHSLLRLVVRGVVSEDEAFLDTSDMHKKRKIELRRRRRLPILLEPNEQKRRFKASSHYKNTLQSYSVPSIFCAEDASQSIYGWRGGAPELTIEGFRRDYPQGVVAQLAVCYRLPNDIAEAYPAQIIPAAAAKVASTLRNSPNPIVLGDSGQQSTEEHVRLGNQLLLSKGMRKIDSTVILHGLWDAREEAKYIASTIRRRSKERKSALISALNNLDGAVPFPPADELMNLTDVAVMETKNWLTQKRTRMDKSLPMKPVLLLTMHRSKKASNSMMSTWQDGLTTTTTTTTTTSSSSCLMINDPVLHTRQQEEPSKVNKNSGANAYFSS